MYKTFLEVSYTLQLFILSSEIFMHDCTIYSKQHIKVSKILRIRDEMQDFFLEKDFIFTLFLAVKFTESDTKAFFVAKTKENLFALASFDVIGRNFNNQKKHKDKLFLQENIYYISSQNLLKIAYM